MTGKIGLLLATLTLLAATCSAPLVYHSRYENRQAAAYRAIDIGASVSDLVASAGEPTYVTDGTRFVEAEFPKPPEQIAPGCVEEYWYHSGILLISSRWSYCLDDTGRVVDKYHWASW